MELDLEPGAVFVHGDNGHGKSNLLEAVYLLAIAKSPRASTDREMVRRQSAGEGYSQVSATIRQDSELLRVQVTFASVGEPARTGGEGGGHDPQGLSVQKHVKVNGVNRRASDLVGRVNAVLFTAQDMELVYGAPAVRRRYMDILISQLDREYLRALQKYQRVLHQRNHLLKLVRDGRACAGELDFWDDELIAEASCVIASRRVTIEALSALGNALHRELAGEDEGLELRYRPSVHLTAGGSREEIGEELRQSVLSVRQREVAQGVTVVGPHRDDVGVLIEGLDAAAYASRGQSRTAVLAMKLAEAQHLANVRRQGPILLLDDVLSELDSSRRARVLDMASRYDQCFITTTDLGWIDENSRRTSLVLRVRRGRIER